MIFNFSSVFESDLEITPRMEWWRYNIISRFLIYCAATLFIYLFVIWVNLTLHTCTDTPHSHRLDGHRVNKRSH